ncbi:MAG TPA: hypothetical protein VFW28_17970 [Micropepsaceae bacterium]|nr:hypothetical protein [Micropepsaceae bacterium]
MSNILWENGDWKGRVAKVISRLGKNGLVYSAEDSSRLVDRLCADCSLSRDALLQALGLIDARDKAISEVMSYAVGNGGSLPATCEHVIVGLFWVKPLGKRVFDALDASGALIGPQQNALTTAVDKKLNDFVISVLANVTMAIQNVGGGKVRSPDQGGWYIDDPNKYVVCPGFRTAWNTARMKM